MTDAAASSETSLSTYKPTRCQNPEYYHPDLFLARMISTWMYWLCKIWEDKLGNTVIYVCLARNNQFNPVYEKAADASIHEFKMEGQ
jgi:hypothetical protein